MREHKQGKDVQYQISGTVMQTLAIDLLPGEIVYSQTNCMCWMNDAIEMNTNTGGGFLAGVGRMLGGGSLFITDFTARGNGHVAFCAALPRHDQAGSARLRRISDLPQADFPVRGKVGQPRDRLAAAHRRRLFRRRGLHPAAGDRPRHG